MSDRDTISVYDAQAARYAELTDDSNKADQGMTDFIAAIPKGGKVLDLGCGPGASAVLMAQAGLEVDAMDASAEMVRLASDQAGVSARQAEFSDLRATAAYDGIWANFSLLHATRTDFPNHIAAIHKALKPDGIFFIAMKLGQGEGPDRLGRYYSYYSEDELKTYLQNAGFTVTGQWHGSGTGLDGSVSDWIRLAAHA
ncbi:class I SAM-dependent methyltransferase [Rhodobacteraceae bacterium B1Z28]|uniref:Class I SAM-dependent methyltransferase n=1 Tax=Ruegeria haliotis TaxID=2747601 RepID=A0ABX2PTW5_9RHOB|nr:methyltransferase domain-containing protein [Ruegeria haliotis]NVO57483.1 class I SAM-dependent methyltransferase [Ruegeria haliotis]